MKEKILDYDDYENKLIIKNLRAVIKVITKSLYNYNLINLDIYDITYTNIEKYNNENDSILEHIEKLIIFINLSTHNMDIIFGVNLARSLLHKPEILLLDEPTSSMDQGTEQKVIGSLKEFCKDKTIDGNILNEFRFPTY